jgi:hypothetical protein
MKTFCNVLIVVLGLADLAIGQSEPELMTLIVEEDYNWEVRDNLENSGYIEELSTDRKVVVFTNQHSIVSGKPPGFPQIIVVQFVENGKACDYSGNFMISSTLPGCVNSGNTNSGYGTAKDKLPGIIYYISWVGSCSGTFPDQIGSSDNVRYNLEGIFPRLTDFELGKTDQ